MNVEIAWGWGRAIPRKEIYKRNCRRSELIAPDYLYVIRGSQLADHMLIKKTVAQHVSNAQALKGPKFFIEFGKDSISIVQKWTPNKQKIGKRAKKFPALYWPQKIQWTKV